MRIVLLVSLALCGLAALPAGAADEVLKADYKIEIDPRSVFSTLRDKGGMAVLGGRFVAVVRALMPAAAGAVNMPYRTFMIHNLIGGIIWGVGYSLLGYVAGSAYGVVERKVGAGLAIALAAIVLALVAGWVWRRHRTAARAAARPE